MSLNSDDLTDYEVCFTVSPDGVADQIAFVRPDHVFSGNRSEDVVIKVRANDEEEAEDTAYRILTAPDGRYVKEYGSRFEVKKKYVWRIARW